MMELDRAKFALAQDKDFEYLSDLANAKTDSIWDRDAEDVYASWNYYKDKGKQIEEFIVEYKVNMFFAIAISMLLDKIHVEPGDPDREAKMYKIPGTEFLVNIDSRKRPWRKRFSWIMDGQPRVFIQEEAQVEDEIISGDSLISFTLDEMFIDFNPGANPMYSPKYLDSIVRIDVGGVVSEKVKLRDLNIKKVIEIIREAGIL